MIEEFVLGECELEELLIAIGATLFTGTPISQVEIDLLERILLLTEKEINKRKNIIH